MQPTAVFRELSYCCSNVQKEEKSNQWPQQVCRGCGKIEEERYRFALLEVGHSARTWACDKD